MHGCPFRPEWALAATPNLMALANIFINDVK